MDGRILIYVSGIIVMISIFKTYTAMSKSGIQLNTLIKKASWKASPVSCVIQSALGVVILLHAVDVLFLGENLFVKDHFMPPVNLIAFFSVQLYRDIYISMNSSDS